MILEGRGIKNHVFEDLPCSILKFHGIQLESMDFSNKHNDIQWGSFDTYRFLRKVIDLLQYMLDVLGLLAFPLQSLIIAIEM